MKLSEKINTLLLDIQVSQNPKSHMRNAKVLGLLLAAQKLWTLPGRQAVAIRLEDEATQMLNDPANY